MVWVGVFVSKSCCCDDELLERVKFCNGWGQRGCSISKLVGDKSFPQHPCCLSYSKVVTVTLSGTDPLKTTSAPAMRQSVFSGLSPLRMRRIPLQIRLVATRNLQCAQKKVLCHFQARLVFQARSYGCSVASTMQQGHSMRREWPIYY